MFGHRFFRDRRSCGHTGIAPHPAVYERKKKWRKLDESTYQPERENYKTAEGLEEVLDKQFQEEATLGMCYRTSLKDAKQDGR